jgi:hypothetical protein
VKSSCKHQYSVLSILVCTYLYTILRIFFYQYLVWMERARTRIDHTPYLFRAMTVTLQRIWYSAQALVFPGLVLMSILIPPHRVVQPSPSICLAVATPRILCSSSIIQVGPKMQLVYSTLGNMPRPPLRPAQPLWACMGRQQRVDNQRSCCIKRAYPTAGGVA